MRKKSGGSKENTFDPKAMPKEDAARMAGRADDAKGEYPLLIKSAELAIEDCCTKNYETEEDKENG